MTGRIAGMTDQATTNLALDAVSRWFADECKHLCDIAHTDALRKDVSDEDADANAKRGYDLLCTVRERMIAVFSGAPS
jgi:hypothetical protein